MNHCILFFSQELSTKLKEMNCDVQSLAEKVPKYLPGQLVQSEQLIEEEPTTR